MILRRPLLTLVLLGVVFTAAFLAAGDVNFARPTQEKPSPAPTISLDIVAADLRSKANEPNRVGPAARINVIAKNDSSEPVTVAVLNQYVQNRPQLFRSGKLVGYRQEIAKSLRARGDETEIVGLLRRDSIPLQPYSSAVIGVLDLSDWYGPLEPGPYRITNRYRFRSDGPWSADSKPLMFEVEKNRD